MVSETGPVKETKTVAAEGENFHDYELVVVITPEATEEKFESRVNYISQFITNHGGAVDNVGRWGKKKLAYPIKKALEGSYVLFRMKLPPKASRELEANLNITEDVLRHLLVKIDEK